MKRQSKVMKKMFCVFLAAFVMCSGLSVGLISYASAEKIYFIPDTYYNSSPDAIVATASEIPFEEYIISELIRCSSSIDISSYNIPLDNAQDIASLIYDNSPELFHVSGMSVSCVGNTIIDINPQYKYTPEVFAEMYNDCLESADKLLSGIKDNDKLSDVQKALLLHDRIAVLCEYDYENLQNKTLPYESYTIYGVLVSGFAVCQGYAEAYLYLLDKVGIDSYLCESDALNHAWNIVIIDGEEYHVDVTWDDPVNDITGRVLHTNFLRSSVGIYATDHNASDYIITPDSTKYDDYFWQDSTAAFQLVGDEIYYIDGDDSYIKKYSDNSSVKAVSDMWLTGPTSYYSGCYSRLDTDGVNLFYNSSQSVFEFNPETDKVTEIWTPETDDRYRCIYGFKYQDNYLYCDLNTSPNFDLDTKENYQQKKYYISDAIVPEGITINTLPDKTQFELKEAFSYDGLSVLLDYTNGTSVGISDGFTVSGGDTSSEGEKTVTVTYEGFSATYKINVTCTHKNKIDVPAVPSTCIVQGHGAYTKCADCNKVISGSDELLSVIEHKYVSSVTTEPTCTEEGTETFTCNVCSATYTEAVPATGHSYTSEITTPATHLTEGVKTFTCKCGDTYTQAIARTPDHTYSRTEVSPTCTEQGYITYTCECRHYYTEEISATGHKDADSDSICDVCGESLSSELTCSHMCHEDGFMGFLWKVINFFNKLFGVNPVCRCGAMHY